MDRGYTATSRPCLLPTILSEASDSTCGLFAIVGPALRPPVACSLLYLPAMCSYYKPAYCGVVMSCQALPADSWCALLSCDLLRIDKRAVSALLQLWLPATTKQD
ncbi:hypothetical protein O6H91_20G038300 [Diphasiastrum complanatum]|uniref:Uncharacterized protein n=1 Tax=Diphasiastrum complanatum TaxID=34168 RepID=A0ACC2APK9_DIPCM|nr:hypothetical protein O6H91_Y171300 [Diphasiastrum complanatum]KAJ7519435.1 hypothetical protein O6H91_20G038300 [Diphasiastrum complanatum]